MNSNYEKLNKKNEVLFNLLKGIENSLNIELNKNKEITLKLNNQDGKSYYINSFYNINNEVTRFIKETNLNADLIIINGLGLGYELEAIIKNRIKSSKIIILENRLDIIKTAMDNKDLGFLLDTSDVYLYGGPNEFVKQQILKDIMKYILYFNGEIEIKELPYKLKEIKNESFKEFISLLKGMVINGYNNVGNSIEDTLLGINHIFSNSPYFSESCKLEDLKSNYKGFPAICVASGPSLDKNIEILKDLQDRALIFCADSIYEKLIKNGISPDAIMVKERNKIIYDAFFKDKSDLIGDKVCLFTESVAYPKILSEYGGPKFILTKKEIIFEKMFSEKTGLLNCIKSGQSCAHISFAIAKELGCNPIILVGQDLAYGEDGFSHAKQTFHAQNTISNDLGKQVILTTKGFDGNSKVKTTEVWEMFRNWFENEVQQDVSNTTYINATEGGAYINGMIHTTLRNVGEEWLTHKRKEPLYKFLRDKNQGKIENLQERIMSYVTEDYYKVIDIEKELKNIMKTITNVNKKIGVALSQNKKIDKKIIEITLSSISGLGSIIDKSSNYKFITQPLLINLSQLIVQNKEIKSLNDFHQLVHIIKEKVEHLLSVTKSILSEYERGIGIITSGSVLSIETPLMGEMYS